jgi:hypothetical protein
MDEIVAFSSGCVSPPTQAETDAQLLELSLAQQKCPHNTCVEEGCTTLLQTERKVSEVPGRMTKERLDPFSAVEIMFEFSKAIQQGLMSLESLNRLDGVDANKVSALAETLRRAHAEATAL